MEDKLKVKVWNYKNIVLYEVVYQVKDLRDKGKLFTASNGFIISSYEEPEVWTYRNEICIKGSNREYDNKVTVFDMEDTEEAKKYVNDIKQAVKEFNENFGKITNQLDSDEKKYLSEFLWPYDVVYIQKSKNKNKEVLVIALENKDKIYLPNFKKGTMYKGMELNKKYTLEELGL